MSGVCGVCEQRAGRAGTGNLPCARGKNTPQTTQTPGQGPEKLAGFGVGSDR